MKPDTIFIFSNICESLQRITGIIREEHNSAIATQDHVQVIRHYDSLRKLNALIKESREALSHMEEHLSREDIPDVMRANNIRSTTIEGVGRVSLSSRWSASMIDKDAGMNWLRNHDHGGVIQETVNAQTLGALAKELNQGGFDLPSAFFKTSVMTFTSITRA